MNCNSATQKKYDIESAELTKIISEIDRIQKKQHAMAIFTSVLSVTQGLNNFNTLGSLARKYYKHRYVRGQMKQWYMDKGVSKIPGKKGLSGFNPTLLEKAAAKRYAEGKWTGETNPSHPKGKYMRSLQNDWYKNNNVKSRTAVGRRNKELTFYSPTPEQKALANEYATGKFKDEHKQNLLTKNPTFARNFKKIMRSASVGMSIVSFGASLVALYFSLEQLINAKSAKEEWDGLMKNHTEGTDKVMKLLSNITDIRVQQHKIEMSTESKQFIADRLNSLIQVILGIMLTFLDHPCSYVGALSVVYFDQHFGCCAPQMQVKIFIIIFCAKKLKTQKSN